MIRRLLIRREDPDRAVVRPPHRATHVLDGTPVAHDIVQRLDELPSGLTAKSALFARAAFETLLHCTLPGIDGAAR